MKYINVYIIGFLTYAIFMMIALCVHLQFVAQDEARATDYYYKLSHCLFVGETEHACVESRIHLGDSDGR